MTGTAKLNARKRRIQKRYGPWAVVTGASDGMGKALAYEIAACGVNVALVARREVVLTEIATDLTANFGIETRVTAADLSKPAHIPRLLSPLDDLEVGLFVAAAGFGTSGPFTKTDLSAELNMIDLNCAGLFVSTRHFAKPMIERKRGGIILFSSLVAFQGVARAANYAATKAYVQVFAEGIQRELATHGVDVLATAPGPVVSGFGERANMVIGSAALPEEVAPGTLYALGRRSTVRPVFFNKFLQASLSPLPRSIRARILEQVMKSFTKHQT